MNNFITTLALIVAVCVFAPKVKAAPSPGFIATCEIADAYEDNTPMPESAIDSHVFYGFAPNDDGAVITRENVANATPAFELSVPYEKAGDCSFTYQVAVGECLPKGFVFAVKTQARGVLSSRYRFAEPLEEEACGEPRTPYWPKSLKIIIKMED